MRIFIMVVATFVLAAELAPAAGDSAPAPAEQSSVLVHLREGVELVEGLGVARGLGVATGSRYHAIGVFAAAGAGPALDALEASTLLAYVEPNDGSGVGVAVVDSGVDGSCILA